MALFSRKDSAASAAVDLPSLVLGDVPDENEDRERELMRCIAPYGTREMVGVAFGPGHGLEQVVAAVVHYNPEDNRRRGVSMSITNELAFYLSRGQTTYAECDVLLGLDDAGARAARLSKHDLQAAFNVANEGKMLALDIQMEDGGPRLEQWNSDLEFVTRSLAVQGVLIHRLASAGKIEGLTYD